MITNKSNTILTSIFALISLTAICQTELEYPGIDPNTSESEETDHLEDPFLNGVANSTIGDTIIWIHNNEGTKKTNPHHSYNRPKGWKHNHYDHKYNRNFSVFVPPGYPWTHNHAAKGSNPHFSTYHNPKLTKHNNVWKGLSTNRNPHYSKYVNKDHRHNKILWYPKNAHFSEFNPKNYVHNRYGKKFRRGQYSLMVPRDYKHNTGVSTMSPPKKKKGKSELKDIHNLEVISRDQIVLSIFPNPTAKNEITLSPIHIPDFVNNATIQVFDLLGKNVLTETIYHKDDNSYQLDISKLEKGTYLIQVVLDHRPIMNGKFIKQ